MKTIREAHAVMLPAFTPLGIVRRSLTDSLGLYVAEDLLARQDLPSFSNSAMDGYAIRTGEVSGASEAQPSRIRVVGESRAGGAPPETLAPGTAMRIFTGAALPWGADAVVIQEDTTLLDEVIEVKRPVLPGQHVRAQGSDLTAGEAMLRTGARLGPGEIGLLAAQRIGALSVYRRPRVALLSTGDELRDIFEPEEEGTLVNSNAYALAAQVLEAGGIPEVLPNVPDDLGMTVARIREGLNADVLVTCGGISVGEYDLVKQAFEQAGVEANFWKVKLKPGKPLTFGRRGETPVVGLPGNPISAMVTFEVFVRPGLRQMLGDPRPFRQVREVTLAHPHRHSPRRPEIARARVVLRNGELSAEMLSNQGSGSLPSMIGVDAFVLLPEGIDRFEAGTRLRAILLRDETGSDREPFDA